MVASVFNETYAILSLSLSFFPSKGSPVFRGCCQNPLQVFVCSLQVVTSSSAPWRVTVEAKNRSGLTVIPGMNVIAFAASLVDDGSGVE